jgi:hypothetical protein
MSAYLVSHRHIAALVKFGALRSYDMDSLRAQAECLARECVSSVSYRYPTVPLDDLPGPSQDSIADRPEFTHADFYAAPRLTPVECLKACACLEYQSCEHPGWDTSQACGELEKIRRAAIRALPGYDSAQGWDL